MPSSNNQFCYTSQASLTHFPGNATLGGTLELQFYNGFTPRVGDSFTLLTADSVSGSFSAVNAPEGTQWSTQITGTSFSVTAIPEPQVLAYLLFAALLCIRFFRK